MLAPFEAGDILPASSARLLAVEIKTSSNKDILNASCIKHPPLCQSLLEPSLQPLLFRIINHVFGIDQRLFAPFGDQAQFFVGAQGLKTLEGFFDGERLPRDRPAEAGKGRKSQELKT
ncbi:hypothetical protein [Pusillimonas sp.]|uniref:hypothetical protein n=1 Tax=Pusillimonas sp. TaxID=3040095 RepID=UPI0037C6A06E